MEIHIPVVLVPIILCGLGLFIARFLNKKTRRAKVRTAIASVGMIFVTLSIILIIAVIEQRKCVLGRLARHQRVVEQMSPKWQILHKRLKKADTNVQQSLVYAFMEIYPNEKLAMHEYAEFVKTGTAAMQLTNLLDFEKEKTIYDNPD